MPGRSTTKAIHLLRSLVEKYRERRRDLHMAFLELENAYDSVSRELVLRTLRDKGTPRRYSRVIKDMYVGVKTRGIQESIPWYMIFADDIVLIAESTKGLNNKIKRWRQALEDNGLRVSREKMEYLRCDFGRYEVAHQEVDIRIRDQILQPNESFRYLGPMIHRSGRIDEDVAHCVEVDMIPNEVFRVELDVDSIIDKMRKGRLRWFGHVKRRPQSTRVRRVEAMLVEGSRKRGRPKLRWKDRLK
nr:ataxia telangiectasia mutated family protein [Tanacetum cinerariifolium]